MGLWVVLGCGVRIPVFSEGDDGFASFELPESEDECLLDADCSGEGCGSDCTAAGADTGVETCMAHPHTELSVCGCVEGRCRWFMRP